MDLKNKGTLQVKWLTLWPSVQQLLIRFLPEAWMSIAVRIHFKQQVPVKLAFVTIEQQNHEVFLNCTHSGLQINIRPRKKLCITIRWLFTVVHTNMLFLSTELSKCFSPYLTRMRFFSTVSPEMCIQDRNTTKCLFTNITCMRFFTFTNEKLIAEIAPGHVCARKQLNNV